MAKELSFQQLGCNLKVCSIYFSFGVISLCYRTKCVAVSVVNKLALCYRVTIKQIDKTTLKMSFK